MIPAEKAKELVNKFRDYTDGTDSETDRFSPAVEKENGKKCALLAVDEIIQALDDVLFPNPFRQYWQEVIKEIEKL